MSALRIALLAAAWVAAGCSAAGGNGGGNGESQPPVASPPASPAPASGGDAAPSLELGGSQPVPTTAGGAAASPGSPGPGATPGTIELPASILDPVVADIARVAGVPVDQVTVVSAVSVTFPDAGLGCPLPGMLYAQVQVDGYQVVAKAGDTTYDYRGTGSTFRRCKG